jgi:MFS family permease
MTNPYREIFRVPGAKGFSAAAFVARMPVAMMPIGIVTMLSQLRDEYWLAGSVAATFTLANAVVAPQISRLVDRLGQSRLLTPATAVAVLAFAIMTIAAHRDWPAWTLFVSALLASTMPSMSAMVRARWTALFRGRPELNTAFAFESAADELVYIIGATLSVALSVTLFPEAGVLVSTVLLALGTAAFVLQPGTEPPRRAGASASSGSAISQRPVQLIATTMVFVGAIFAASEVTVVALTRELGRPEAASLVIGVYAAGSFIVGIALGSLNPRAPLHRQLLVSVSALLLLTLPLLLADSVAWLAFAIFLSGLAVSPTFITSYGVVEKRVSPAVLTEGVTWVGTGVGIGMALGAFFSGWAVDHFGARNGFWVSVLGALVALGMVALSQKTLAGEKRAPRAFAQTDRTPVP